MGTKHLRLVRPLDAVLSELEANGADATLVARARRAAPEHLAIPVGFNPRLHSRAGQACRTRIELNEELELGCSAGEFLETLLHELAHIMAWDFDHGHGYPWRQACRILGIQPTRCHNYATMQRRRR